MVKETFLNSESATGPSLSHFVAGLPEQLLPSPGHKHWHKCRGSQTRPGSKLITGP